MLAQAAPARGRHRPVFSITTGLRWLARAKFTGRVPLHRRIGRSLASAGRGTGLAITPRSEARWLQVPASIRTGQAIPEQANLHGNSPLPINLTVPRPVASGGRVAAALRWLVTPSQTAAAGRARGAHVTLRLALSWQVTYEHKPWSMAQVQVIDFNEWFEVTKSSESESLQQRNLNLKLTESDSDSKCCDKEAQRVIILRTRRSESPWLRLACNPSY